MIPVAGCRVELSMPVCETDDDRPGKIHEQATCETFGLDRLKTPIGTRILVSDADGVLRALDWEDHEPRMKRIAAAAVWRW